MSQLNDLDYETAETQMWFTDPCRVRELQWTFAEIISAGLEAFLEEANVTNVAFSPTREELRTVTDLKSKFSKWDELSISDQDATVRDFAKQFRYLWI